MLDLIDSIKTILPHSDVENAVEMVEYNEFGVGFEIICQQLFENDVKITSDIYEKISDIGQKMEISDESWIFLSDLVKDD